MLIQEKMSHPETLLTLYVASDEELYALQPQLRRRQLPVIRAGGHPALSAAAVLTVLV